MADLDSDTEEGVDTDYYAVLNVRKEANEDELKAAYKRMCVLYHPDKHQDPSKKKIAVELFSKIQRAYEVLGNPETRAIYDVYGQKGLDAGWEIIERQRTPAEIREEYERLQREKEERRLEQITNPSGRLSVGVDATDLFDRYEDLSTERVLPVVEISSMSISQSIEAPITRADTVTLAGSLSLRNGNGSGYVSLTARRVISYRAWGEVELSAGDGPTLTFRAFRNLSKNSYATAGLSIKSDEDVLSLAGFNTMIARHLDKHTVGYLTWTIGAQSSMKTTVIRETEHSRFALMLQLGFLNTFAVASYTKELDKETKVKASFKSGTFGTIVEYGCERQISKHSKLGGTLSIGLPVGVILKIRLTRASQVYNFPINLSSEINPAAIFYGTVAPVAIFLIVKVLIIKPFLVKEKEKEVEARKEKYAKQVAEKRRAAENSIRLMQDTCQRILAFETSRHGLIIVNAWYGHLVSMEETAPQGAHRGASNVIDVTIPVQCQVKDSRLFLTEASKSDLNGFYDPCPEEEKMLRIKYLFRESLHEVTVGDKEAVRIPKQSHKIITS